MFSGLPPKADRRLRWYIAHRRMGAPMAKKQRVEQWAEHRRQRDEEERQCRVNGHQRHSQRDRRRWLLVHVRANWSQRERRRLSPLVRRVGVVR
jgi:hypothetical protein